MVDPAVFRQLCGRFATGVVVVTTADAEGEPVGMTANSFTAVSLQPPLVSVNIDRAAEMHQHILASARFVINILESGQETISRRFAGEERPRFDGVGYRRDEAGMPILIGALATIECLRHAAIDAGDHTIVVGLVTGGETSGGRPLLYYRGGYHDGLRQ
jgi:flavin reductase (DIM6/NTAB) family NADH-FMN oxidoreductase RutF